MKLCNLAGSAIINTGPTTTGGTAGGDVGLSPATGAGITGLTTENVDGTIYTVDAAGPAGSVMAPGLLTTAKNDLVIAYNDAASRTPVEIISADLDGRTLFPGVYKSESSIALAVNGTLTLDGQNDPKAVFIFQATDSTLITGSGSKVVLTNGAQPCRVFWQIGSSATLGTNSDFVGHILAFTSITVSNGAEVKGQLLAINGAVTLENNRIINDVCLSTGSLTVGKVVSGDTAGMTLPPFEITVTGPEGFTATRTFVSGETFTWTNLVPGTYTVTENKTGLSEEWTVTGEGSVQVVADQTAVMTVTNSYIIKESSDYTDWGPSDSGSSEPISNPQISIIKIASLDSAEVGDDIIYTFIVRNTGNVFLSNVTVEDDKLGTISIGSGALYDGPLCQDTIF